VAELVPTVRGSAWPLYRQKAQDLVEYGLIVAVLAVVGIISLNTFGSAQAGYFAGLGPNLAPATVTTLGEVRHSTVTTIQTCAPCPLRPAAWSPAPSWSVIPQGPRSARFLHRRHQRAR
jgi:Flp pilus assembly pilin Flp